MVRQFIEWSLKNRFFVLVAAAILMIWGGYEAAKMPVDVFPDLNAPTVSIITEAHGMAPEEIESLITFPIETVMNGASHVRRVRSATAAGFSVVWVEFEWNTDIYKARQIVTEKLQLISAVLPPESELPTLAPISSIMGEILFIALESKTESLMNLRTIAEWNIRRRLMAVPGVSQVGVIGGELKQYQVLLDPLKLRKYELTIHEIKEALQTSNENAAAGFLVSGPQEYLIRGVGRIRSEQDIENTVIAYRNGQPTLVKHVAKVEVGRAFKRGDASYNTTPAVILTIQKQPETNSLLLTKRLEETLDDVQKTLPEGVTIRRDVLRQADFIELSIHHMNEALRDGTVVVVIVLAVFLASFHPTLITILAIPISLIVAVLSLKLFGGTINTMTLGGLVIALGALVDDAVIDVENVVRRLRENFHVPQEKRRSVFDVVLEATLEIRPSIVFATLIIILVFVPLFFLSGLESRLMAPLGLSYVTALLASLAVSLIVTPVLCYYLLPKSRVLREKEESRFVTYLKDRYRPILEWSMNHRKKVITVSGALLFVSLLSSTFMGRSFLPEFNEGALTISAVTLPGTSLEESDRLGRQVEKTLLTFPEVKAVGRRTGRAEGEEHTQGVNASELEVSLEMKKRSKTKFLEELRKKLKIVPGVNITIGQPISHRIDHMLSGTRANLAVKLFGGDLTELRKVALQIQSLMQNVEGVVDLSIEQQANIPMMKITFNRNQLAKFGLSVQDVTEAIETAFRGTEVGRIYEGETAFDFVMRYEAGEQTKPDEIGRTLIDTHQGTKIPLSLVADVQRDSSPNTIMRENVQRKTVVMCNIAGRDLGSVVDEVHELIKGSITLPAGYFVEYGGQFEAQQSASRRIIILGIAVLLGIAMLLTIAFGSLRDTLFIMLNLPLALIGGVLGVFLSGGVLSIASLIGFITLFGIAARNGIMLITHIQHLMKEEGVSDFKEAVMKGSLERLAPILMTALSTGFALLPLAFRAGLPGSEIQSPMAIVILCGLLSSTLLSMLVIPTLYFWLGKPKKELVS
jgi:CzcA family heavy metal efflux pump